MNLHYKGFVGTLAGQVGTNSVYTASHNPNGYLVVTALTSGASTTIPAFAKILAGTNFASTGLVITEPKLGNTPQHAITVATSGTILANAVTLSFTCTGYMNWVNGASVTITGVTPSSYDGVYTLGNPTSNTSFTVSKTYVGEDGSPGLPNATGFGTASMVISNAVTGLYKTNLLSTIASTTDITFTGPNIVPAGSNAVVITTASGTLGDFMYYNPVTKVLESICLPVNTPQRIGILGGSFIAPAVYGSTAVSGTSINKILFYCGTQ